MGDYYECETKRGEFHSVEVEPLSGGTVVGIYIEAGYETAHTHLDPDEADALAVRRMRSER